MASTQHSMARTGIVVNLPRAGSRRMDWMLALLWSVAIAAVVSVAAGGLPGAAHALPYVIAAALVVMIAVHHKLTAPRVTTLARGGMAANAAPSIGFMSARLAKMDQANALLLKQLNDVTAHRDTLERQINIDPLTGAQNRRGLETAFAASEAGMVFAMLDLDHFKQINDTLGHQVGDRVLQEFAAMLRDRLGNDTPVYRIGGEEFIVMFPQGDVADVADLMDGFRRDLAKARFTRTGDTLKMSFSAGIAVREDATQSFDDVYKQADENLYAAKTTGRGKTVYSDQPTVQVDLAA